MFGRGRQPESRTSSIPTQDEIAQSSNELEDMLNVARDRNSTGRSGATTGGRTPTPSRPPSSHREQPSPSHSTHSSSSSESGDRALVLVRAMVNAAKSDGQIDQTEQQNILQRLSDRSAETVEFLRTEFSRPLDVHEFARSVPVGMEQQVYMLSLITIDLDTSGEAKYLTELADSLRISPEARNQIHTRVGAPSLY
jgi:uncharacterized membrane protein YebE (DUF533 family)